MEKKYESVQKYIVKLRRDLHQIPELGTELPKTKEYIVKELERLEIPYICSEKDSGILATIKGGRRGRTVALRTDMDALPLEEETDLPFASVHPGCMHACGHDAHMAILLGAARLLNIQKKNLCGTVRLIFQTAEEISRGSEIAIANGYLEGVDAVFGLHIGSILGERDPKRYIDLPAGVLYGVFRQIYLEDPGEILSWLHTGEGVDPVNIAAHLILSLQAIQTREISGSSASVITIGKIAGGAQYNVIPDEVVLEGTIRALDESVRHYVAQRIRGMAVATAAAFGGSCECEIIWGAPPVVNDEEMAELAAESVSDLFEPKDIIDNFPIPNMGGEDFANYLQIVPGAFFFLSSSNPEKGTDVPHHNPQFDVDEDVMWRGAVTFERIVMRLLG